MQLYIPGSMSYFKLSKVNQKKWSEFSSICYQVYCGEESHVTLQQWLEDNKGLQDLLLREDTLGQLLSIDAPSHVFRTLLHDVAPEIVKINFSFGKMAIHKACSWKGVSIDAIRIIHAANPTAIMVPDKNEDLPLHNALEYNTARLDIINMLVSEYKLAAEKKNMVGMLPLHIACSKKAPLDIVSVLLNQYRDAVEVLDNDGELPLHHVSFSETPLNVIRMLVDLYPNSARIKTKYRGLLLHLACAQNAPVEVFMLLFSMYPGAAEICDHHGMLPLHTACYYGAPLDVVLTLLNEYPDAARIPCGSGKLPLHCACGPIRDRKDPFDFACFNMLPLGEVIRSLLEAYPKAAKIADGFGRLPLHIACKHSPPILDILDALVVANPESIHVYENGESGHNLRIEGADGYSLLKDAIVKGYSVHLVSLLLQQFLSSCIMQDENGNHLLHLACMKSGLDISPDVIALLLQVYPDSSTNANRDGKTPLDLLEEAASYKDGAGKLLLHRMAALSKGLTVSAVKFVADAYPESTKVPDMNNMLPFHHACLNVSCSIDVLLLFLQLSPDCIKSDICVEKIA
jgi:ankyrin repeat protein